MGYGHRCGRPFNPMIVSRKTLTLLALAGLGANALAVDVTSINDFPSGWYVSDSNGGATASLNQVLPDNGDHDGALMFNANGGNGKNYVSFGAFPAYSGSANSTFPSLGTLGALANGSISADLFRSSTGSTPNPATDVVVKLIFSGNRQLTWENANNGNDTTTDSWFNQMMGGSGRWWIRGAASGGGSANFDVAGGFRTLTEWAGGFTPSGYAGGALGLDSEVLGFTVGFGSGVGNFVGGIDHLNVSFAGENSYSYNFRDPNAVSSVPAPAALSAFVFGLAARVRRRKRA